MSSTLTNQSRSVVEQLRSLILSGALEPGERLREVPLAARLGISRTPLRPALAALEQEGLLQRRDTRGYLVRKVSIRDVLNAYFVRANLEGLACALLAGKGLSDELDAALRAALDEGDQILSAKTLTDSQKGRFREVNDQFHGLIIRSTENDCLEEVTMRTLSLPLISGRVVHFDDYDLLMRSHQDHHIIYGLIKGGHQERAKNLMIEHILRSSDLIERMNG